MADFAELEDYLLRIAPDPALIANFKACNPRLVSILKGILKEEPLNEAPKPFPAIDAMTAIQVAVFDNWTEGKRTKQHPNRYGMAVEVWTAPASGIKLNKKGDHQFKSNVRLMDKKTLKARVEMLRNASKMVNPISVSFADDLTGFAEQMADGDYLGLINSKPPGAGTVYHDGQAVYFKADGASSRAVLVVGADKLLLPRFDARKATGEPLDANVILQSRCDRCGFSQSWATPDWDG